MNKIEVVNADSSTIADMLFLFLRRPQAERTLRRLTKAAGWLMPGRMERARLALHLNYERQASENEEQAPTDWRGED